MNLNLDAIKENAGLLGMARKCMDGLGGGNKIMMLILICCSRGGGSVTGRLGGRG